MASVVVLRRSAPPLSDGELIARALAGDERAKEALFLRHAPGVTQMADRVLRDPIEAEDVVQHTFEVAFRSLQRLEKVTSLRAWLLQIAVRRCHRIFRRRNLARLLGLAGDRTTETLTEHAEPGLDAEHRAELALLDLALARVGEKDRVAWMLRHVEGLALEECAQACSCSLATVKRRIAAAEAHVRAHVERDDV